ncbi:MAG: glutamine--tRNA ligase/YqeY domain fusion protein [Bacteroidetes bacterium]|nr:MAG: glutamine--tRNA ligase/YqeY domain fusion protein [Bacteroidota bacterium]
MDKPENKNTESKTSLNFLEQIIENDIKTGKYKGRVLTRFPPEPNGYLHIGHAKSICLNFGLAAKYNGKTNLRFDDTNPTKESTEYVDAIQEDVKWLGFQWEEPVWYASDYFEQLYEFAVYLIKKGKAFVCQMTAEEISKGRGTPQIPGVESPWRNRSVEENLDLLHRMRKGEFKDGQMVLRAKIDMASPNMHMRDPVMYRIMHAHHHRTGDAWCIYPTYDWAHGQSDYIEKITHSICTLEFEVHRPLYEWFLDNLDITGERPRQYEFARLNLSYTVMSKRKLLELVEKKFVNGWDDPRMPTVSGLRRRGFTPAAIRTFADRVGVAKRENIIDVALLEYCIREDLNKSAPRTMTVLNPVKLIIDNYPEGQSEELPATINPEEPQSGQRMVPFSRELYIEREDFMENPPKKFFRLAPGQEVRLKYAYIIRCDSVVKDDNGEISEIHCTYFPDTKSGMETTRKVKGTLHWVSIPHAVEAEVRLYDRLFSVPEPEDVEEGQDFKDFINPDSLKIVTGFCEPSIKSAVAGQSYQFERLGYFNADKDSTESRLVFNRTVTLRDSWARIEKNRG